MRDSWSKLAEGATLRLAGSHEIPICKSDVSFLPRTRLAGHPNALTLSAWGGTDVFPLLGETYFSIGGGFIRQDGDLNKAPPTAPQPMEYSSGAELLALCDIHGLDICDIARVNEESIHSSEELDAGLDAIWDAMHECVEAGLYGEGTLPGGLGVPRRPQPSASTWRSWTASRSANATRQPSGFTRSLWLSTRRTLPAAGW